ncbi:uncharacterized protein LOC112493849 [Cephus cinctus]|uniref:Uncharacterized protein LOC112493849 n=1 Tax=Cephus cinctus TaxID=211228 RepID=A0AAJ7RAP0_CEPCN|nr:uncharacterized protein LOC112493849 [Cephus cinctus]
MIREKGSRDFNKLRVRTGETSTSGRNCNNARELLLRPAYRNASTPSYSRIRAFADLHTGDLREAASLRREPDTQDSQRKHRLLYVIYVASCVPLCCMQQQQKQQQQQQ